MFTVTEVPIKSPTEYFLELSKPRRLMWEDEEPRQFSKRRMGEDYLSYGPQDCDGRTPLVCTQTYRSVVQSKALST